MKTAEVRRAIRRFQDLANDVLRSNGQTFDDNFSMFLHYCETDDVLRGITGQLKANTRVSLVAWYQDFQASGGSFIGSKRYSLPRDEEDRLALLYQFFLATAGRGTLHIPLLDFMIDAFGTTSDREIVATFNQQLFGKFARDLLYRLEGLSDELPEHGDVPEGALIIFNHNHIERVSVGNISNSQVAISAVGDANVSCSTTDAATLRDQVDSVGRLLRESAEADEHGDHRVIEALEELGSRVALFLAEEERGRAEVLSMLEDLWLGHAAGECKPRFVRLIEQHAPPALRTLALKVLA